MEGNDVLWCTTVNIIMLNVSKVGDDGNIHNVPTVKLSTTINSDNEEFEAPNPITRMGNVVSIENAKKLKENVIDALPTKGSGLEIKPSIFLKCVLESEEDGGGEGGGDQQDLHLGLFTGPTQSFNKGDIITFYDGWDVDYINPMLLDHKFISHAKTISTKRHVILGNFVSPTGSDNLLLSKGEIVVERVNGESNLPRGLAAYANHNGSLSNSCFMSIETDNRIRDINDFHLRKQRRLYISEANRDNIFSLRLKLTDNAFNDTLRTISERLDTILNSLKNIFADNDELKQYIDKIFMFPLEEETLWPGSRGKPVRIVQIDRYEPNPFSKESVARVLGDKDTKNEFFVNFENLLKKAKKEADVDAKKAKRILETDRNSPGEEEKKKKARELKKTIEKYNYYTSKFKYVRGEKLAQINRLTSIFFDQTLFEYKGERYIVLVANRYIAPNTEITVNYGKTFSFDKPERKDITVTPYHYFDPEREEDIQIPINYRFFGGFLLGSLFVTVAGYPWYHYHDHYYPARWVENNYYLNDKGYSKEEIERMSEETRKKVASSERRE